MVRTQISLERELHRRARERARELGVSLAELTRRALERELRTEGVESRGDITAIFALGDSGGSDVAREKDRYLAEATRREYERKLGSSGATG